MRGWNFGPFMSPGPAKCYRFLRYMLSRDSGSNNNARAIVSAREPRSSAQQLSAQNHNPHEGSEYCRGWNLIKQANHARISIPVSSEDIMQEAGAGVGRNVPSLKKSTSEGNPNKVILIYDRNESTKPLRGLLFSSKKGRKEILPGIESVSSKNSKDVKKN